MKQAILLDTSAIMYRAFYANPNFRTKNEPTGAIYGFILTLQKIIKEFSPEIMAAAFDVSRSTLKRTELYKEYKAHRDAAPEDLIQQIPRIEELLEYYGISKFKIPGHEADDVLATLANQLSSKGYEVTIITGDKDITQLINENENHPSSIRVALMGKGDGKDAFKILSSINDVKEHLGVAPSQIPDYFGLIGDSSDGIPGVRKIGPKKAVQMIEKYGNLEEIYKHIEELSELPGIGKSLVQNIIEDKELAFLSRRLATVESNIDEIEIETEKLKFGINKDKLVTFFNELEFKTLIKKMDLNIENEVKNESLESEVKLVQNQLSFGFEENNNSHSEVLENIKINFSKYQNLIIDSDEKMQKIIEDLKLEKKFSIYSSDAGIAISLLNKTVYIPLNHNSLLYKNFNKNSLNFLFENSYMIIGYNIKNLFINGYKFKTENILSDSLIAHHLLSASTKDDIEHFAKEYADIELLSYSEEFKKSVMVELDPQQIAEYMFKRARILYETNSLILKKLENEKLIDVFYKIEVPLIEVLADMEINGIKINISHFEKLSIEFNQKLEEIKEKIYLIAGQGIRKEFNLNSPKQLGEILFMELGLPILKKNKTGPSTDVEVLEGLNEMGFEIAALLLEHRKFSKIVQTYVEPLPKLVDKNSRLHSSFNQIGTATGRLSSSNPNLQNIPVKSDEGMRIREGFVADSGKKLIGIDYSQIELRVLAEMTEDENLLLAYRENKDLHEITARKIFSLDDNVLVTREQRTVAKIVNFSLIYGKTAFGLAKELKIPQKEAASYINSYFEQYPKVKEYEHEVIEYAEKNGYVRTMFGRKRAIEGITSRNKNIKMQAERMAVNTIIQGTAAEIIKLAMIKIYKEIKEFKNIKLILQVHDELIFEVDEKEVSIYLAKLEEIMKTAVKFNHSKIDVNGFVGDNWAETK